MSQIHLLVLIHGMWGNPSHLFELERIILEVKGGQAADGVQLETLVARANQGDSTYDGIDWGAERVADEVRIRQLSNTNDRLTSA